MNGGDFLEVFVLLFHSTFARKRKCAICMICKTERAGKRDRLQCNVWCIAFMDHVKVDGKVCAQVDLAWWSLHEIGNTHSQLQRYAGYFNFRALCQGNNERSFKLLPLMQFLLSRESIFNLKLETIFSNRIDGARKLKKCKSSTEIIIIMRSARHQKQTRMKSSSLLPMGRQYCTRLAAGNIRFEFVQTYVAH